LQVAGDAVRHALFLLRETAARARARAENAKNDEERGRSPQKGHTMGGPNMSQPPNLRERRWRL